MLCVEQQVGPDNLQKLLPTCSVTPIPSESNGKETAAQKRKPLQPIASQNLLLLPTRGIEQEGISPTPRLRLHSLLKAVRIAIFSP